MEPLASHAPFVNQSSGVPADYLQMIGPMDWTLPAPMRLALSLAQAAASRGEVPVGAVVMRGDQIIATAANRMRARKDPTAHAEMEAIRAAAIILDNERLDGCDLWVTLEPCAMCAGAIAHARVSRLYYGAADAKGGAIEHGPRFFTQPTCLHRPEIYSGFGEGEAAQLLKHFFAQRR
jgi:tRNA(adenine34) deaminase